MSPQSILTGISEFELTDYSNIDLHEKVMAKLGMQLQSVAVHVNCFDNIENVYFLQPVNM